MAKRVADGQITKDSFDRDSEGDEPQQVQVASSDVLARRKILKPKGRIGTAAADSNGFKGFGGFGAKPAGEVPAASGNAFGFLSKPATQPAFTTTNTTTIDKNSKIRALNEMFVQAVNRMNTPNTVVDFTSVAEKYINYYKKIGEESASGVTSTNTFNASAIPQAKPAPTTSFTLMGSNQQKLSTVPASTFSFNPPKSTNHETATKPSTTFNFGKTTAPTFGFNIKKDDAAPAPVAPGAAASFSFKPSNTGATASGVTFGQPKEKKPESQPEPIEIDSSSEEESEEEIKIQGPQFTLSTKPTVKSSPFTFDPKKLAKKNEPDSDDSEDEIEIKGPTFQFNKAIKDDVFKLSADPAKPKIAFNVTSTNTEETKKDDAKPGFSFGTGAPSTAAKPTGLFGSTHAGEQKENKLPFSFGTTTNGQDNKTPSFNFSAPATTTSDLKENKPALSFGGDKPAFNFASTEKKDDKPGFSFGNTTNATKPSFSFNASASSEKSGFSFGSAATKPSESATKPTFSFKPQENKQESTDSKPEQTKPLFQFSFNPANQPQSETPKSTFSFGTGSSITFGAAPKTASVAAAGEEKEADDSKVEEEESGAEFTPVARMPSEKMEAVSTGEEDEDLVFSKRAKLMEFDVTNTENPYINKGVGDLKILKNKETGKSRILIRADGGLRILLNCLISKDITYSVTGPLVRVPTIDPKDPTKFVTYVLRVKTPADGEELLKAINESK
ncbi:uncharacterized protein J8A68_002734 [[Candida] subhashii]|uniref:RanBD1 domain-containing protein n=1 Tax=[Candida] subhashii TaxID=561895 RepID=A0A8J5UXN4_9ASCO|nr:uncharacterized protein J8A68_002734 [[Candida] subhashii]KAG7663725.1 hypothetical protein J8A68_002734 [[Candida] subhashii]